MRLLIDAGNTRIKWALVEGEEWLRNGALAVGDAVELRQRLDGLQGVQQIWASNVAGEAVAQHIRNIHPTRPELVRFIVSCGEQCGVSNGYAVPSRLGSDRWAALIAAWHLVGDSCLVVNCGTAITVDALSGNGRFLGGLILPGLELMQRGLTDLPAQLDRAGGAYAAFPLDTADALLSGAIQAACGAIERQYALLEDERVPVILSGGSAGTLQSYLARGRLNAKLRLVDNLVLQGLLVIAREAGE